MQRRLRFYVTPERLVRSAFADFPLILKNQIIQIQRRFLVHSVFLLCIRISLSICRDPRKIALKSTANSVEMFLEFFA